MAKPTTRRAVPAGLSADSEHNIEEFAEDLGRLLGEAQNKAEGWLTQRKAIVAHLTELRDTANRLIAQMGGQTPAERPTAAGKRGPGRPKGSGRKKRTMSAEARERIAAAQRARWAKQKARKQ